MRGEIEGATVTLYFSEALDEDSVGGRFLVHLDYPISLGGPYGDLITGGYIFPATGQVEISGNVVTVGLGQSNPRARPGLPVSFYYRLPADRAKGLRDLAGNEVSTPRTFDDGTRLTRIIPLDNLTAPSVTGVAVSSDAGDDDTYAQGEAIRVRLTFSEAVAVTGAPRVKIDFSSGTGDEKWADYTGGGGTTMLEFAYTVVDRDLSTQGIAVLKNTLALNGGTMRGVGSNRDTKLAHAGLDHDANHKVDWRLSAVTGVALSSDAGEDDTYAQGEVIRVRLTFSKAVAVTGAPRLKIDLDSADRGERWAGYASGGGTKMLEFAYTVERGDASSAGVAVLANTLALNGGTIRTAGTQVDTNLAHVGADHNLAHKVDGTAPTLLQAAVDGVTLTLTFDEDLGAAASLANGAFTVKKMPQGGTEETVGLSGSPAIDGATVTLTLARAVLDTDTDVKVSYARPDSGTGNRLRDAAGNEVASFANQPVTNSAVDVTPPELVRGEIDGGTMTLFFSEPLDPDSVGGVFRVSFRHVNGHRISTQATGDVELSGSAVTVGLGNGRRAKAGDQRNTAHYIKPADPGAKQLRDLAGNTVRTPHGRSDGSAHTRYIILDNVTGVALTVTEVEVSSDAGDDATYGLGDTIRVRLTFSKAVVVTGAPRVKIDFSSQTGDEKWVVYASGSGTKMLEFAYTVAQGDASSAGVAVFANTLDLNGGTIRSASAAGENATLAHASLDHDPAHRVDARPPTLSTATVDGILLRLTFNEPLGAAASLANGAFTVKKTPQGDTEEAVSLSGTPTIDGATVTLTLANAVLEADTDVKVSYTKPTSNAGNRLRDEAGNEVASFSDDQPVTHGDLTPPRLVRGEIDGGTITLFFSEPLNEDCVGGAFRVEVRPSNTVWTSFVATGDVKISGNVVTVGVGEGKSQTNTGLPGNKLFYFLYGNRANWLQDLAGNVVSTALRHGGLRATRKIDLDNVTGVARLSVADARANEGAGVSVAFEVSLSSAATDTVTVDYATADGSAAAGSDYTATSGTLTFAAGDTAKTVSVPVLDDAVDEGEETFTLTLSNATGARIADGEATGTIANDDPLQTMWLSRFGRTVASHVTDAVSDRLAAPLSGAQVTVGGQRVDLAGTEDGKLVGEALTAVARALGASGQPAQGDGFGPGDGQAGAGPGRAGSSAWPGTGPGSWSGAGLRDSSALDGATTRDLSGRELLLGSAFHLASEGDGTGPGLAAWGRVTFGGFDGEEGADAGGVRIDGEVTTGILGADAEWNRLLAGVAISVSEGEGTFDQPGVDSGTIESAMTAVSPYARLMLNDRLSVWGLAGWGTGDMTIVQAANDDRSEQVSRADLSMRLAAVGGRGALLEADEAGGIDLGLRADAFFVETEAEAVSNEGGTTAAASRVRLALEGSRAFRMDGGGTLTPGAGARASP